MGDTLSNDAYEGSEPESRICCCLFRVLHAHAPHEAPSRHALLGLDDIAIGRGDLTQHRRDAAHLRLDLADAWASQHHARLTPSVGRWQIEDLGSKNGVLVNGARISRTVLVDGDVVEIGRTFFVFGAELAWSAELPLDAEMHHQLPGVASLVPSLSSTFARLALVAAGIRPILVTGPTGAGKELVARAIHATSRRSGPFVGVNCAAIPRELLESTLFGHRRGAFSGALDDAPGLIRASHLGTLFLDEIGDLPLQAQGALLRVLQEREVTAVGTARPVAVDLRVVCATHRDIAGMVAADAFRADLLHRLKGFSIALPTLADRRADLGDMLARLLDRHADGRAITLHPRVARAFLAYNWPGNVRELEQVLGTALGLTPDGAIHMEHLPREFVRSEAPKHAAPRDQQRDRLVGLLGEHHGNIRAVARALGKDPVQIRRWLKRYGLVADAFRN